MGWKKYENFISPIYYNLIDSSNDENTFSEKIQKEILFYSTKQLTNSKLLSIKDDILLFESSGELTEKLSLLLKALMSIKPTSIDSERVFSTSTVFLTKYRASLSDKSINALSVLKSYFQKNK